MGDGADSWPGEQVLRLDDAISTNGQLQTARSEPALQPPEALGLF